MWVAESAPPSLPSMAMDGPSFPTSSPPSPFPPPLVAVKKMNPFVAHHLSAKIELCRQESRGLHLTTYKHNLHEELSCRNSAQLD